jgi:tripartite-type tricarboxylate transporter receptor subunit TctC
VTRRRALLGGLGALAAVAPTTAQPAWSPDRPVRITVPFPPGALTDVLGRMVADTLQRSLGQTVVVENRPGGATLVGAAAVARQPADGHHLLIATSSTLGIALALQANPPIRPEDFAPIAMLGDVRFFLVANRDLPVRDLPGLLAAIRAAPGRWNYASPGSGTIHHLLMETILRREGLELTHVPYQGSMQALADLTTGRLQVMWLDASVAVPQIAAGAVRALAVNGARRRPSHPELPAAGEVWPDVTMSAWQTVVAPAGAPEAAVARINAEVNRMVESAEGRRQLDSVGVEPRPMTPAALRDMIRADAARWAELVRAAGLAPS